VTVFLREKMQSIAMFISGALIIGAGSLISGALVNFPAASLGAEMQSGAGYGLYVVVLAGAMAAAGGVLAWKDIGD